MERRQSILQFSWVLGITIMLSLVSGYLFANAEVVESQISANPAPSVPADRLPEPAVSKKHQKASFLSPNDSPLSLPSKREKTHEVLFMGKDGPVLQVQTGTLKGHTS